MDFIFWTTNNVFYFNESHVGQQSGYFAQEFKKETAGILCHSDMCCIRKHISVIHLFLAHFICMFFFVAFIEKEAALLLLFSFSKSKIAGKENILTIFF